MVTLVTLITLTPLITLITLISTSRWRLLKRARRVYGFSAARPGGSSEVTRRPIDPIGGFDQEEELTPP